MIVRGRLIALDLGTKRVGVAVSDELRLTTTALPVIERRSWKDLLRQVRSIVESYDARGLVVGLPLNMDGTEGSAAAAAKRLAENFRLSLTVPVYLQDERLTSIEAGSNTPGRRRANDKGPRSIDSQAAEIILRDYLASQPQPE